MFPFDINSHIKSNSNPSPHHTFLLVFIYQNLTTVQIHTWHEYSLDLNTRIQLCIEMNPFMNIFFILYDTPSYRYRNYSNINISVRWTFDFNTRCYEAYPTYNNLRIANFSFKHLLDKTNCSLLWFESKFNNCNLIDSTSVTTGRWIKIRS